MSLARYARFFARSKSIETRLIESIGGACLQPAPFPHAFARGVFPESYYRLMLRNFPDPVTLVSNGQAGRGNTLRARFVFELKQTYLRTLPDRQRLFWSDFAEWFLGERLRRRILDKFEEIIRHRFGTAENVTFGSDAVLVEDQMSHSMGPHTDHPRKAVTLLFYLPGDVSQAHLGTSIYLPKDPGFVCSGMAHHSVESFDRLTTFPFVPNALLMFAKTDNSFHGVEPIDDANCRRRLLMLNVNVL